MSTIKDRIRDFRRVPASTIRPNAKNWRLHPDAQRSAMQGVLSDIGIADALLVRELPDGTFELVDGHLRHEELAGHDVPVLVLDLDEAEADKLLTVFDPLAAMATIDREKLDALLADIETDNEDVQALLDSLAAEEPEPTTPRDPDAVPEVPSEPVTRAGDLWRLGEHRLLCGDCRIAADVERVMAGRKINVAVTSPPYASQRRYDESSGFKPIRPDEYVEWWHDVQANVAAHLASDGSLFVNIAPHAEDGQRHLYVIDMVIAHVRQWGWRFVDEFQWVHSGTPKAVVQRFKNGHEAIYQFTKNRHKFRPDNVRHHTDAAVSWGGRHPSQDDGQGLRSVRNSDAQGHCDPIKAAGKTREEGLAYPSNVLSVGKNREALGHGPAFPVALPAFFVKAFSDADDVIFEPFCGSGSTLIAAEQHQRRCFATEISPAYCDVIVKRWEGLTGQSARLER